MLPTAACGPAPSTSPLTGAKNAKSNSSKGAATPDPSAASLCILLTGLRHSVVRN